LFSILVQNSIRMEKNDQNYGVALQGFIAIRKEAHERAEMITQVLFGEHFKILDDEGLWMYIRTVNDAYEGWLDRKSVVADQAPKTPNPYLVCRNTTIQNVSGNYKVKLPAGASIPLYKQNSFVIAGQEFHILHPEDVCKVGSIALEALIDDFISVPYLWGGRCGFGTDCSGLTQYLCRALGKNIPRDANEQSAMGDTLSFINEAQAGDLAFFDDTEGMIHHVGMIVAQDKILHSSGRVRIDKIDQQGIFSLELGRYTHKLRVLKRV